MRGKILIRNWTENVAHAPLFMNKSAIWYSCRMIKSLKKYNIITTDTNNMIIKLTLHFLHVLFHIHIDWVQFMYINFIKWCKYNCWYKIETNQIYYIFSREILDFIHGIKVKSSQAFIFTLWKFEKWYFHCVKIKSSVPSWSSPALQYLRLKEKIKISYIYYGINILKTVLSILKNKFKRAF